jgi:hypothetical protein
MLFMTHKKDYFNKMYTKRRIFLYSLGKLLSLLLICLFPTAFALAKTKTRKISTKHTMHEFPQSHPLIAKGGADFASIKNFGAIGDGSSHLLSGEYATLHDAQQIYPFVNSLDHELDWAALQAALNSGRDVLIPEGRYIISEAAEVQHRSLKIYGEGDKSILVSDDVILKLVNCSDSVIGYLRLENATSPFLIDRWKDGMGYQPTVNDPEYKFLSSKQQNQNITPQINIMNSQKMKVKAVSGNFTAIVFWNSQYCSVSNCNIRAGKSFAGGIVFWSDSLVKNVGNEVIDNEVRYASFSGIVFSGAESCICKGNRVEKVGESCYKTWSGEMNGIDLRCRKIYFNENLATQAYYDNFDLSSDFPHQGTHIADIDAIDNISLKAGRMGFYADGRRFRLERNTIKDSGLSGMFLDLGDSTICCNQFASNNQRKEISGHHELSLTGLGRGNFVKSNVFKRDTPYNGNAIYNDSPDTVFVDNTSYNASFNFKVAPLNQTNNLEMKGN